MKRALTALMVCAMMIGTAADAQPRRRSRAAAPPPPAVAAQHVAILDANTGIVLGCENCNEPIPPASMSKLMTVLVVAERLKNGQLTLDQRFRVSENAWRHGAMSDGSHMFLELNSEVSVRDLLQGLIIVSANDACVVLAEGIAGSEEAFVDLMNRRAQEIGLRSARFRNATGLPDPDHVISTADLARLAQHLIVDYPDLYRFYSQRSFTYNNRTQENRNPLLGAFDGADGVKTGHTNDSGYGMVGSAVLNGQRRIIAFNGTNSMAQRRTEALRIMRAAFHDYSVTRIAAANQPIGEAQVWMGGRETVPLVSATDVNIGGARAVQLGLNAHIVYQGPVRAPIQQGQEIAKLVVEGPGYERQEFPLVAGQRVGRANPFARAWTGLGLTLGGGGE